MPSPLPPPVSCASTSFPTPQILLVTLNRPQTLNCISIAGTHQLDTLWKWFDEEPSLRVAILTGAGRAFCTGADLKEFQSLASTTISAFPYPDTGFAGLSSRLGKKPIISAVNGICFGGGCEIAFNSDIVIASHDATFAIQDVKIGTVACAGVLPRLVRTVGLQPANEMALMGRIFSAQEAKEWGLINKVVGERDCVVLVAVEWAKIIAGNSPDSVIATREGIRKGWVAAEASDANLRLCTEWGPRNDMENYKEGIRAFKEKRAPRWVDSKL